MVLYKNERTCCCDLLQSTSEFVSCAPQETLCSSMFFLCVVVAAVLLLVTTWEAGAARMAPDT